jgi:hypothetical protein
MRTQLQRQDDYTPTRQTRSIRARGRVAGDCCGGGPLLLCYNKANPYNKDNNYTTERKSMNE